MSAWYANSEYIIKTGSPTRIKCTLLVYVLFVSFIWHIHNEQQGRHSLYRRFRQEGPEFGYKFRSQECTAFVFIHVALHTLENNECHLIWRRPTDGFACLMAFWRASSPHVLLKYLDFIGYRLFVGKTLGWGCQMSSF